MDLLMSPLEVPEQLLDLGVHSHPQTLLAKPIVPIEQQRVVDTN
jgi:hypothetical protein